MMGLSPFPLEVLLRPTALILGVGFLLSLFVTRSPHWSVFVAFLKSGLFVIYFGVFFDGTFTFSDDWTYLERGSMLLAQGVNLTNLFHYLPEVMAQIGSKHFVYYLYNADSFRLFGEAYYAPVALNVTLTFVAAAFMAAAGRRGLGFSRTLVPALFLFSVLHPDILAWSTIMNGKDTLVLTCTAVAVYAVSIACEGQYLRAVVLAIAVGLLLFFTRFYVPLMLLTVLFATLLLSPIGHRHPVLWLFVPAGLITVIMLLGAQGLADAYKRFEAGFVNPLYGIPRMLLTPIPFHTTDRYAFLDLPQVFHWALIPFLVFGVYRVWRRATFTARFVVIYFSLMILLYGMFDNLQGPRHRVQLDGLIALFQFCGVLGVLKQILLAPHGFPSTQSRSVPVEVRR